MSQLLDLKNAALALLKAIPSITAALPEVEHFVHTLGQAIGGPATQAELQAALGEAINANRTGTEALLKKLD